ncbi:hypothetical protein ABW21_db0207060 [Orbilia brochopaga]|nr:hypothetical protein ABW21_db0207060 [Drechslerella brochopaga]
MQPSDHAGDVLSIRSVREGSTLSSWMRCRGPGFNFNFKFNFKSKPDPNPNPNKEREQKRARPKYSKTRRSVAEDMLLAERGRPGRRRFGDCLASSGRSEIENRRADSQPAQEASVIFGSQRQRRRPDVDKMQQDEDEVAVDGGSTWN